jgi:hypothetical protein
VNDLEFIREQVRTERRHMAEVRQALGQALEADIDVGRLEAFCRVATQYLIFVVQRFNQQDGIHCDQLRPKVPADDTVMLNTLAQLVQTLARNRAAILKLAQALQLASTTQSSTLPAACRTYLEFYRSELATQRNSLYPLMEQHYSHADWRRASLVDADSILEERERYQAVRQSLPAGIELKSSGRPAQLELAR